MPKPTTDPLPTGRAEDAPGSTGLCLTAKQWLLVMAIVAGVVGLVPAIWKQLEPFDATDEYRIPYSLSEDYWLYERYSLWAANRHDVLVVGDSVVWGEYVTPAETLSCCLDELAGPQRFANLGVNAIHPVALAGLLEHHGKPIQGCAVLLHSNPLWMSSPRHDLRPEGRDESTFNHPRLVPQWLTDIPCYEASASERLGIVLERRLPYWNWVNHVRIAYFESLDLHRWTLEHPRESPLAQITLDLPIPATQLRHRSVPWYERRRTTAREDLPWVELEDSLQWRSFLRCLEVLEARGNRVFVLLGPFNEHLLTTESRNKYRRLKGKIEAWLAGHEISFHAPPALPSEQYADASHPLAPGYRALATELGRQDSFREWLARVSSGPGRRGR